MTILERFYTSGGPEVEIDTLTIQAGSNTYYLCKGWDDITARLETGELVTFTACAMNVSKPAKNADGVQDLRFALSNLNGVVSNEIRQAIAARTPMRATLRTYLSTDLNAPSQRPFEVVIKGGQWTAVEVQITAGFMNILDTAWPRNLYNLTDHPGLRYLT